VRWSDKEHVRHYYEKKVKYLLKAAHILHYCSIAILGIFVIQVSLRLFLLAHPVPISMKVPCIHKRRVSHAQG